MFHVSWRRAVGPVLAAILAASPALVAAQDALEGTIRVGVVLPDIADDDPLAAAVIDAANQGFVMAEEEFAFNAELFELGFEVVTVEAAEGEAAAAAASLVDEQGAFAVVGGFGLENAEALGAWAAENNVPFLNIGASSDSLRNETCAATAFHVVTRAAMYLDAMAGWYVRAGFRQWYVVQSDDPESAAQNERLRWPLEERFFGARIVGESVVAPGTGLEASVISDIEGSGADLVILLQDTQDQLASLAALEEAGATAMIGGFPHAETQTRAFFATLYETAPTLNARFRATAWEATLDAYGARELNARFRQRWEAPMEPSAWAAFQAVKILYEAAFFGGSTEAESVLAYIENPQTVFDTWKGIGTTFRSWDRQLRQPVYLIEIDGTATDPFNLALLVGELPAIYLPGTDPVERLDQLGDLEDRSTCGQ